MMAACPAIATLWGKMRALFFFLSIATVTSTTTFTKITGLNRSNALCGYCVPPQGGGNDTWALLDEQSTAGDPANNISGSPAFPTTAWAPGFKHWMYPQVFALIDLGALYDLTAVYANHHDGSVIADFSVGPTPFKNTASWRINDTAQVAGEHCFGWGWKDRWCGWNMSYATNGASSSVPARYLTLRLEAPTQIAELLFYGKQQQRESHANEPVRAQQQTARTAPLFRSFAGTNVFVNDPVSRINAVGVAREYHDWVWTEGKGDPGYPHALNAYSPGYSPFDFDAFYNATHAAGIEVHQCLQGRPYFLDNGNTSESRWKPVPDADVVGAPALLPSSYVALAAHAFQTAARYGRTKVDDALLQLAPNQKRLSGLGVLAHMESMNEPDGTFPDGLHQYMQPYELAAMHSALFDGHERSLGAGVGITVADPTMKVVMSGLADGGQNAVDWVKEMALWAQANRKDGRFPAHVINLHRYCFTKVQGGVASSPEECYDAPELQALVAWRDAHAPDVNVWLSEFGWDTDAHSPNRVPVYGGHTANEVQGMWLARAFLVLAAQGLDRVHQFMLRDTTEGGWVQFATSGLVTAPASDPPWAPKASWYMVKTLVSTIGHMRFVRWSRPSKDGEPYVAFFQADAVDGNATAAPAAATAVWLGTATGQTIQYDLQVASGWGASATLVELVDNSTNGNQRGPVPIDAGGHITLTVGESPLIVLQGGGPPQPPSGPVPPIDPAPAAVCASKPRGLFCVNWKATGDSNSTYYVCPEGTTETCPNGDLCVPGSAPATVQCVPQAGPCDGKKPGLYCSSAVPKPGWPGSYTLCPSVQSFLCPTDKPMCVQSGTTVTCDASGAVRD